jgi:hypothetical protein
MHHLQILMALCVANFFAEDFTRAGKQGDATSESLGPLRCQTWRDLETELPIGARGAMFQFGLPQSAWASTRIALLTAIAVVHTGLLIASIL